ncbi:MAG: DNA repair protein RecN [Candidatus Dormibacteria bacterium]
MLIELRVDNLAVMQRAECSFGPGLNAITGETGAGKSVLLAALALALGGRSDPGLVRAGSERASTHAVFSEVPPSAAQALDGLGVEPDDVLVLGRELQASGRSTARVNAQAVPVSVVRELGEALLEVHGQGASSHWLHESEQRQGVDAFGGDGLLATRALVGELFDSRQRALAELARLRGLQDQETRELEVAVADLEELRAAALVEGEDRELLGERDRLLHSSRLREAAEQLHLAAGGGDLEPSGPSLAAALQRARVVSGIDPELDRAAAQAEEAAVLLQELVLQLGSYLEHLPDDNSRLGEVEERLALLERLARRHGGTLAAAIDRREKAARLVADRGGLTGRLRDLEAEVLALEERLMLACSELSAAREAVAKELEVAVTEDLRQMLMPHARFSVRVWRQPDPHGIPAPDGTRSELGRDGWDRVSFLLAPNRGDQPRPLRETASGGELSRVALALLSHLSRRSGVGTVVFDEIDQGLGGEAANRVGELMRQVSTSRQVICVTHLAPIAARATTHLMVVKKEDGSGVSSRVETLDRERRVLELARLLAGEATPAAARRHAEELLVAVGREVG